MFRLLIHHFTLCEHLQLKAIKAKLNYILPNRRKATKCSYSDHLNAFR